MPASPRVPPVAALSLGLSRALKRAMEEESVDEATLGEWSGLSKSYVHRVLQGKDEANIGTWIFWSWLLNRKFEIVMTKLPKRQ